MTAYRIISAEKASGVPVSLACELLEVSRSGYYEWSTRAPSDRELTDAWLTEKIKQIHAANREVYGSPRIHAELRMAHGIDVGRISSATLTVPSSTMRRSRRCPCCAVPCGSTLRLQGLCGTLVHGSSCADQQADRMHVDHLCVDFVRERVRTST
ncbi:MAG: IS3 family transposase [Solirubrobacteraceae bacterium]